MNRVTLKSIFCFLVCIALTGCDSTGRNGFVDFEPEKVEFSHFKGGKLTEEDISLKKIFEDKIKKGAIDEIDSPTLLGPGLIFRLGLASTILEQLKKEKELLSILMDKVNKSRTAIDVNGLSTAGTSQDLMVVGDNIFSYEYDGIHKRSQRNLEELLLVKTNDKQHINQSLCVTDGMIISGSIKGLRIWSLDSGEFLTDYEIENISNPKKIIVNNGRFFCLTDSVMSIVDINTGELIGSIFSDANDSLSFLDVSDDYIVVASKNARKVQVYDSRTYEFLREIDQGKPINGLRIHGDKLLTPLKYYEGYLVSDFRTGKRNNDMTSVEGPRGAEGIIVHKSNVVSFSRDGIYISDLNSGKLLTKIDLSNVEQVVSNKEALFVTLSKEVRRIDWEQIENVIFIENQHSEAYRIVEKYKKLETRVHSSQKEQRSPGFLKLAGIEMKHTYKHGKIGERYVPYTSTSYSTPNHETTYINGNAYTQTSYEKGGYSSGGYDEEVRGYKAIYRLDNSSDNYYFIRLNLAWSGKYSSYETYEKGGMWSSESGTGSELVSESKNSSTYQSFMLAPNDNFKFQFEVGESKSFISLSDIEIKVIPKKYYDGLIYAMEEENEAVELLDKFFRDSKIAAWRPKIHQVIENIRHEEDERFDQEFRADANVAIRIDDRKYDKDFDNMVEIIVESKGQPMCINVKTPLGIKQLDTSKKESGALFWKKYQTSKTYNVKGVAKDNLNVAINDVSKYCR